MNTIYKFLFLILSASALYAQTIEFSPMVGRMFAGSTNVSDGQLNFVDGTNYSFTFDFRADEFSMLELSYSRLDTEANLRIFGSEQERYLFDMAIEYYQIGSMFSFRTDILEPFFLFTIGGTRFHPKQDGYNDNWRFSLAAGIGLKLFLTENVGIRLQGKFMLPFAITSASFWCDTEYEYEYDYYDDYEYAYEYESCGVDVTSVWLLPQFDLQCGFIITL